MGLRRLGILVAVIRVGVGVVGVGLGCLGLAGVFFRFFYKFLGCY